MHPIRSNRCWAQVLVNTMYPTFTASELLSCFLIIPLAAAIAIDVLMTPSASQSKCKYSYTCRSAQKKRSAFRNFRKLLNQNLLTKFKLSANFFYVSSCIYPLKVLSFKFSKSLANDVWHWLYHDLLHICQLLLSVLTASFLCFSHSGQQLLYLLLQ